MQKQVGGESKTKPKKPELGRKLHSLGTRTTLLKIMQAKHKLVELVKVLQKTLCLYVAEFHVSSCLKFSRQSLSCPVHYRKNKSQTYRKASASVWLHDSARFAQCNPQVAHAIGFGV